MTKGDFTARMPHNVNYELFITINIQYKKLLKEMAQKTFKIMIVKAEKVKRKDRIIFPSFPKTKQPVRVSQPASEWKVHSRALTLIYPLCPQLTLQTHPPGATLKMAHNQRKTQVWFLALIQSVTKRNKGRKKRHPCPPSFLSLQPFLSPPSVPVSLCVSPNYAANK